MPGTAARSVSPCQARELMGAIVVNCPTRARLLVVGIGPVGAQTTTSRPSAAITRLPCTTKRRLMPREPHWPDCPGAATAEKKRISAALVIDRMADGCCNRRARSLEAQSPECRHHVKIGRILQCGAPGAELVPVRVAAVDAEEIPPPLIARCGRGRAERGERNTNDR